MADKRISIRELKKEKRQLEKELTELVEEPENVEEIARAAAAVPLPKGNFLEETEIAEDRKKEAEGEENEFFLTTTTPRRKTSFDDSTGAGAARHFEDGDEEEKKEKEKSEDKYRLPSEEEQQEFPSLDPHKVISDMAGKGMFMDQEQVKKMGLRGERTKFHEMFEARESKAGTLPEGQTEVAERAAALTARGYERMKEKEKEKSEGKAFGKEKGSKYRSYKE